MMNEQVTAAVLVARQVFELRVTAAEFLAQGPVGRVQLIPFLVNRKSEETKNKKTKISDIPGLAYGRVCAVE